MEALAYSAQGRARAETCSSYFPHPLDSLDANLDSVAGCDEPLIGLPVFGLVVLKVPHRPPILKRMFTPQGYGSRSRRFHPRRRHIYNQIRGDSK